MKFLKELMEDIGDHEEVETGVKSHEDYESRNYRQVVDAVAAHFEIDPAEVDELSDKEKRAYFNMLDMCWDTEDNKVPDTCPIDINIE